MADILSPQGQWRWDEESQDWVPNATSGFQGGVQNGAGVSDVSSGATSGDNFKKAYLLDLMETGGKNLSKIKAIEEVMGKAEEKEIKKQSAALRKEYRGDPQTKSFLEIQKQWNNMQSAGETGGGDISIMYSYIKMLDPTTAVREGELALGDAAAGLPDRVVKAYNKAVKTKGAGLAPEQRKQFIAEGGKIYNNVAKEQQKLNSFYSGLAIDSGADPDSVIGTLKDVQLAEVPEVKMAEGDLEELQGRGYLERLFSLEGTKKFLGETPQTLLRSGQVGATTISSLLKGDVGAAKQANIEFQPEVERYMGLQKEAKGEIGDKIATVLSLKGLLDVGKGALGLRGKLAGARDVAATGVQFEKQALINQANEALRLNPGAKNTYKIVIKQIENAKDVKDLLRVKNIWNDASFTRGGTTKSSLAANFYGDLTQKAGEEIAKVAPKAAQLQGVLRASYQVPKAVGQGVYQGLKFSALGRLLGL